MMSNQMDLRANFAALCRHESGHHVVARMCGFRTGTIHLKVDLNGGRSGQAKVILSGAVDNLDKVETYLENRVKILYAGAAAEALRGKWVDQCQAKEILGKTGGETDWARARDCIQLLRNVKFPDEDDDKEIQNQLEGLNQASWSDTVSMVEKSADVIDRLVEMMKGKVTPNALVIISQAEIEEVEGVSGLGQIDRSQP